MLNKKLKNIIIFTLLLLIFGCAHVNYIGKSYSPSQHVDLFYSKDEIKKEYTIMGHAIGAG